MQTPAGPRSDELTANFDVVIGATPKSETRRVEQDPASETSSTTLVLNQSTFTNTPLEKFT